MEVLQSLLVCAHSYGILFILFLFKRSLTYSNIHHLSLKEFNGRAHSFMEINRKKLTKGRTALSTARCCSSSMTLIIAAERFIPLDLIDWHLLTRKKIYLVSQHFREVFVVAVNDNGTYYKAFSTFRYAVRST